MAPSFLLPQKIIKVTLASLSPVTRPKFSNADPVPPLARMFRKQMWLHAPAHLHVPAPPFPRHDHGKKCGPQPVQSKGDGTLMRAAQAWDWALIFVLFKCTFLLLVHSSSLASLPNGKAGAFDLGHFSQGPARGWRGPGVQNHYGCVCYVTQGKV